MARRLPKTTQAALAAFNRASPRHRDLPFLHDACPMCGSHIHQSTTGHRRILRHFTCDACGFWVIIEDAAIQAAILGSADGDDTAHGSNGSAWFNSETGKLVLYPTDAERRRGAEYQARAKGVRA